VCLTIGGWALRRLRLWVVVRAGLGLRLLRFRFHVRAVGDGSSQRDAEAVVGDGQVPPTYPAPERSRLREDIARLKHARWQRCFDDWLAALRSGE